MTWRLVACSYLIGTDNGSIHKCSAIHVNQFFMTYTGHIVIAFLNLILPSVLFLSIFLNFQSVVIQFKYYFLKLIDLGEHYLLDFSELITITVTTVTITTTQAPVYKVKWCPYESALFASCGADMSVKLWYRNKAEPLLDLLPINPPNVLHLCCATIALFACARSYIVCVCRWMDVCYS